MPTSFVLQESALHITISPQQLNIEPFLQDFKNAYPTKLRLAIHFGKSLTIRTNHFTVTQREPYIDLNNETWIIPCPLDIEKTARLYQNLQVCIEKPGAGLKKKRQGGILHCIFCPIRCVLCILKWILCLPCALLGKIGQVGMRGVNYGAAALGSGVVIGDSQIVQIDKHNGADIAQTPRFWRWPIPPLAACRDTLFLVEVDRSTREDHSGEGPLGE
jgi:hypothetical protein